MSLIGTCLEPGCTTKCIGLFCVAHDSPPQREFPRGRPWPRQPTVNEPVARASAPAKKALTPVRPAA
jgi:hypothetical protein